MSMDPTGHLVVVGPLRINPLLRTVSSDRGPLGLTKGQYDLLMILVRRQGEIVPYRELHEAGCGVSPWMGDTRAVRQQLSKLGRAIGHARVLIRNVRGFGYALVLDSPSPDNDVRAPSNSIESNYLSDTMPQSRRAAALTTSSRVPSWI